MIQTKLVMLITRAFETTSYPGDTFLQGSEAYEETQAFKGTAWQNLNAEFLDNHSTALSFFSEAAFRFYIPAYLIKDVEQVLRSAEPLFYLTSGFRQIEVDMPVGSQTFKRRSGGHVLLNPQRYGAMTFEDYARYRLSVFCKEEAKAIVAYLKYKHEHDDHGIDHEAIDAALEKFWLARVQTAPTRAQLEEYLSKEQAFTNALMDLH